MLTEFQESVLHATIAEMRRALDDPDTGAAKQLELLSAFIEADPDLGVWRPVPLDS